jgi:curved DNA-binding protein
MAGRDYYKILGVEKGSSEDELKKAYRRLAMQFHPDRNPNDSKAEDRFKEINEAYAVLSDTKKRKEYDMFGAEGFRQRFSQEDIFRGTDFQSIFDDLGINLGGAGNIFEAFFNMGGGGSGRRTRSQWGSPFGFSGGGVVPGQDAITDLRVSFYESIHGGERVVSVPSGDGGWEKVSIKIPAGVATGKRLRVRGKGGSSPMGGPRGDLYLKVMVEDDPVFTRDGDDVRCDVSVPISVLVLGGTVEVPTLGGPRRVKVKAGTPAGAQLRLQGLGAPGPHGRVGDIYAHLVPAIPTNPSERVRKLFEELATEGV